MKKNYCIVCFLITLLTLLFKENSLTSLNDLDRNQILLVADHSHLFEYNEPAVSPDGNLIAWTTYHKFANDYFDPSGKRNPLKLHPSINGTKIFIGGNIETPIEISTEGKSCFSPSWSPDGSTLAYYSDADGTAALWLYNLREKRSRKAALVPINFQWPIQKLIWSKNGLEIYVFMTPKHTIEGYEASKFSAATSYHSKDTSKKDSWLVSLDIIAINTETGTWRPILVSDSNVKLSSFSLSPSGRWLAFSGHKNSYSTEVHGTITELGIVSSDGKNNHSIMDSIPSGYAYPALYAWHPSLDHLYFLTDKKVWEAKFSEEGLISCNPICLELGAVDSSTLAFTKDEKYLIVGLDAVDLHDYSQPHASNLALISCEKGESHVISLPKEWIFNQLVKNSENLIWQPTPNTLTFAAKNKENSSESAIIQLNIESGKEEVIWKGNDVIHFFGFNNSHDLLYGSFENFNSPKEINIFDINLKDKKIVSKTEPKYDSLDVGTIEFFETDVPAANGKMEKVQTAIILPTGTKKGDKLPTIVVHYPGADATRIAKYFGGSDLIGGIPNWLLTNSGFAVILPNLVLGEAAIGKPLKTMTDRLLPQIYEASNLSYIDINRVGIMGQSYGGYGTAGIISHTDLFHAAVATNGTYDLASFTYHLDSKGENKWITWAELDQGNMGQNLYEDPIRYIENSPFYRADKIHTPLLLLHGRMDDAFTDAGKMFSALRRLNREAELVIYDKGHHTIHEMRQEDHLDAAKRILEFFHRYLDN